MFSGGRERDQWYEMGQHDNYRYYYEVLISMLNPFRGLKSHILFQRTS